MSFSTEFTQAHEQPHSRTDAASGATSLMLRLNLHSKALSVLFLDFGLGGLFSRPSGLSNLHTTAPQAANLGTAMALLLPPALRYTFDKSAQNPSFFNGNSKPNYLNLGNDWALNLDFLLSKNLNLSNPELSKPGDEDNKELRAPTPEAKQASFDENFAAVKGWLDDADLDSKHKFIDELLDYFLFTPDHLTDLINYLKVKIDRLSFNDDLDLPPAADLQPQPPAPLVHGHHQLVNNLDLLLMSTPLEPLFQGLRYAHGKLSLMHTPHTHEGPVGQSVVAPGQKDQPQVFSPLLAESGFLQNQAMRYANGGRHLRAHLKLASMGGMTINTESNDNYAPLLVLPMTTLNQKRGPNNLSINTNLQSAAGPQSAGLMNAPQSAVSAGPGASAITSPALPMTPGGFNMDGLDPSTRLKLQALSTINSRLKLDALKKTAYTDGLKSPVGPAPQQGLKTFKLNGNLKQASRNTQAPKKQVLLTPKRVPDMEEKLGTPNNNLAQALKSLQAALNESAAILNGAGLYDNGMSTPVKQATLSLLLPKLPGLNLLELIDLKNLSDLPVWLKNLRLHKYTKILEGYLWQKLIYLSDEELEQVGVTALGARRKLLKAFDIVKVAYENDDIIGLEKK